MAAKNFECISNIVKNRAEEFVKNSNTGRRDKGSVQSPDMTLAITDELLKQVIKYINVMMINLRIEI